MSDSSCEKLHSALDSVIETGQDFTDSAYTSHDNREKIVQSCDQLRVDIQTVVQKFSSQVIYKTNNCLIVV